jgi:anaerobic selenocysteine-containing dehydrogenase
MPDEQKTNSVGQHKRPLGPESVFNWITTEALYDAVLDHDPYPIRAYLSFGVNVLLSHADARRGAAALDALDFMVHADLFMTPTATHADIVLPVNTPWEREGLRTGFTVDQRAVGHVQLRRQVVESRGESRSDAWIAFELAQRLGLSAEFWDGDLDAGYRDILAPSGIELDDLREQPAGITMSLETRYRKYAGGATGFNTPSKKIEIYSETFLNHGYAPLPEYIEPAMGPVSRPELAEEFPLVLTTTKSTHFLHSQMRALPSLRKHERDPRITLHPQTAAARAIEEGDWVVVATPNGRARGRARLADSLDPRVVRGTHGWWQGCEALSIADYDAESDEGANLSRIIGGDGVDPISGSTPMKSYLCQVTRLPDKDKRC